MEILVEELDRSLWVAATKNNQLQGLEIDPDAEEVRYGSIYRARVTRIDKSMDAAFLDLDGDNTGILHNADLRIVQKDGSIKKGGDVAIGKMIKEGQIITVQAKSGYMPSENSVLLSSEEKSAKMSMDITLPGRYLIYAPLMEENRLSTRIRDKNMRKAMHKMLDSIETIKGYILRAAAANTQTDILIREGKILQDIWGRLQEYLDNDEVGLIMLGPDAIQRTLSDHADKIIDTIQVIVMDHFELVEEWCEIYAPDLVPKIEPVELDNPHDDLALYDYRDITSQVDALFQPYAILEGGSSIVIQETAALTSIDINRGSDNASILDINLQAAQTIARHLRLRNLGGIIVIDFLKMKTKKDQGMIIAALEKACAEDPCTVQLHGMTGLGLIELTRRRRTPALQDRLSTSSW